MSAECPRFRPDHNGECLDCDDWIDAHTIAAGGTMRSELRVALHATRPGESVIEIWYGGAFVGEITAADGPGVRVISKYMIGAHVTGPSPRDARLVVAGGNAANVIEIEIGQ